MAYNRLAMAKHKVSLHLPDLYWQQLCAVADYDEESIAGVAAQAIKEWLDAEYRQAKSLPHVRKLAVFDRHMGIALPRLLP